MQVLECDVEFEDGRRVFDGHFASVLEVCWNAIQPRIVLVRDLYQTMSRSLGDTISYLLN